MKPLLLVDVDGVLAPFHHGFFIAFDGSAPQMLQPWEPKATGYSQHPVHGVFWSPDNTRRLRELEKHFELHWGTGWEHRANEVIAPIHGFEEAWPVMEIGWNKVNDCDQRKSTHWKITSIHEYGTDRSLAFIDDEISPGDIEWAEWRSKTVAPTLFVKTDPQEGMTDEHVKKLIAWSLQHG